MKFILLFILLGCSILLNSILASGCSKIEPDNEDPQVQKDTVIVIDPQIQYQTIRNFGASDAWTCQFVGLWPDIKRNQVADWLFSIEMDTNGQPKGIGLSLWRFNIGAGSATQNNISDEWRRTESFLNSDGTYNWTRQAGQRWFLKAASERGVNQFLCFTNSPPIYLTKNGKAYSSTNNQANIAPEKHIAFSKFLTDVAKHFSQNEGITFNYLSPFNEPQWDWTDNGQEGSPYTNREMYDIVKILDSIIDLQKLPLKILLGEAGKINYLYEEADKPSRGNQIFTFFNQNSPFFIGALPSVEKSISAHSYFTTGPVNTMISVRQVLKSKLKEASMPLEFWQSEYCILGDQEEIKGGGKDLGINTALYVSRIIHHDLTVADASTWQWWLAVSAYDYKDGLIYVDKNKTNGAVEASKLLWALGNFSRFIRPGSFRVNATGENININDPLGLMVSSYIDVSNKNLVTIIINYGLSDIRTRIKTINGEIDNYLPYITSTVPGENLKPLSGIKAGEIFRIPKRSIITLVGSLH